MKTSTILLSNILNCGYLDVDYLLNVIEFLNNLCDDNFIEFNKEDEVFEIIEKMKNEYGGIDFSGVMFEVLNLVVDNLKMLYGVAEEDFEIIINGCSSSLNYDGDQDEVYAIVDELNNL